MGLYDTIKTYVLCPYCKKVLSNWQTKYLGRNMYYFTIGDRLPNLGCCYDREGAYIEKGWINGCDHCNDCNIFYEIKIFIKDGRITDKYEIIKAKQLK